MKTIIIPAWCGISSPEQLKVALNIFDEEQIHCIFLQVRPMPDNYNDMLTIHKTYTAHSFSSSFNMMVKELQQEFAERLIISTDYIYGDSPAVFRNYVNYKEASLVIYDKDEWQNSKINTGLNIFRMVSRCGCELMYAAKDNTNKMVSKRVNNLSRYFLNESLLEKMMVQSECSLLLLKR